MAHVATYKKQTVQELIDLIKSYPIIGSVNMENIPAQQLQVMREQLRGTVHLRMSKRRLISIALKECESTHPGISALAERLEGMPSLLFTKENPFKLYKTLQKNKSPAPAKGGQKAPKDIVVSAGPTGFAPGPIIGELGSMGIKAGIEGGKVAIKQDAVVARQGDVISAKLAEFLTRLGIKPMEVGLDLVAVYEDGDIIGKDILSVDESVYIKQITMAHRYAFNLAMEAVIPTAETTEPLLMKAFRDARGLAVESAIITPDLITDLIVRAHTTVTNIKAKLDL